MSVHLEIWRTSLLSGEKQVNASLWLLQLYCWLEIMSEISLSSDRVTDHPQCSVKVLAINTWQELDYVADIFLLVSKNPNNHICI